jgi:ATP-binding cassette subfamily B protein
LPGSAAALLVVPVGLLVAYGLLRLSTRSATSCASWSSQGHRRGAQHLVEVFQHLHALSLQNFT